MEDTHEFVKELHEKQASQEQNEKRQGKSHHNRRLPSKQHSTNK